MHLSPFFSPKNRNPSLNSPAAQKSSMDESMEQNDDTNIELPRIRKKRKRFEEDMDAAADKRGVCYLSRVPPRMDPSNLRQLLSRFGEIQRIYLSPQDPTVQVKRKQAGGFQRKEFSEGWVEFAKKSIAKKVANMLNGEQIGGRRRSSFYYDIWNIKYLSKFKWDDLTSEIAEKNRTREQKLALEISAAKRERDFYLSKVDQSRALNSMQERMKKKKTREPASNETDGDVREPKIIRKFPQNRPVNGNAVQSKPALSKDFLTGVFSAGS